MTIPNLTKAVTILQAGGLVAFPTETVYGLGADASNEAAVRKIFRAKERPFDHPLIVHLAHMGQVTDWARDISSEVEKLAHAFWPGPLTIIVKKQPQVLDIVTGGQDTIGLRIPRHPVAQVLLKTFGKGIAAPSANKFTHISPTTAEAVREELGERVDLVLDGGECAVGLESTIVDMSGEEPVILRPGIITLDQLTTVLGRQVLSAHQAPSLQHAPGMHHVHYAPATTTLLLAATHIPTFLQTLSKEELPIALVTHSQLNLPQKEGILYVRLPGEAAAYAHDLYRTLRSLDHRQLKRIIIETVPENQAWEAIRDRLNKASGRNKVCLD